MLNSDINIKGGELCIEKIPSECGLIIFGASGDLSFRKLIPSLIHLFQKKLLPKNFFVLGCGRTGMDDESFRSKLKEKIQILKKDLKGWDEFLKICHYVQIEYQQVETFNSLFEKIQTLDQKFFTNQKMIFYFATPPTLYGEVTEKILSLDQKFIQKNQSWPKFVYEKPFCWNLKSALKLNNKLHKHLDEKQIYRIDHYLGKDTVQNILMFRFANTIFEPIWNNQYIDHVQITVSESIGVEHRAGYFEKTGLLRDMFQNHILQMIALTAMEPPVSFDSDRIRDEKVKVFRSIRHFTPEMIQNEIVRAQYINTQPDDKKILAYREEAGVRKDSQTETLIALKCYIDNWRWEGVPFYVRAGKRMPAKMSQIGVVFKPLLHSIFPELKPKDLVSNVLIFSIQPDEGVTMVIQAKQPGPHVPAS